MSAKANRKPGAVARLLMAVPAFARAVRFLAGGDDRPPLTFRQRVAFLADELRTTQGISAVSALAAAEALTLADDYGLRFARIEFDQDRLLWEGYYETGPAQRPAQLVMPLELATEATQSGVGSLN